MGARERIRMAIDASVDDARKLLDEAPSAPDHDRLAIQINAWGRGLTAALEELAVELDAIRAELHQRHD